MKFGQLIEYNMRTIFLEKSFSKCAGETSPRPFFKTSILTIQFFIQFVFIVFQVEDYQIILK